MKLATFLRRGEEAIGVVDVGRGQVFDLTAAAPRRPEFASMLGLIKAGEVGLDAARVLLSEQAHDPGLTLSLADVRLRAPLPVPEQIRDFSVFPDHIRRAPVGMARMAARLAGRDPGEVDMTPAAETPAVYRQQPIYYFTNRFSVSGPDDEIPWPRYSRHFDFELEFGIVIGRMGRDIPTAEARRHIFGYTIFNDFSARDAQCVEMRGMLGPAKGKSFDGGNAMGPWIVTPDEIPDPYSLRMAVSVNGVLFAEGNSAAMLHSFEDMIAFVSRDETIHPGEFFGSGTMGNGCGLESDRWLADGDLVTLEVEGIGVLANRVRMQPAEAPAPLLCEAK